MKLRDEAFLQGYACCLATLIRLNGINDTHSDELFTAGIGTLSKAKEAGVDEYDMDELTKYYSHKP